MGSRQGELRPGHFLEYAATRLGAALLRGLPLAAAAALGRCLGRCFCSLDGRHRQRVIDNLLGAFGEELDRAAAAGIARNMYRHFGTMLAEFVRQPGIGPDAMDAIVDWQGQRHIVESALAAGRGVIFATGHIGNWEMSGSIFHLAGFAAGAVARPLDNPLLDGYVNGIRQTHGHEIWDKFGALRAALRVLKQKQGFGILVDQDAGRRGVFVPFFGRPASTIPTPADLAMRTGAPIMVCAFQRAAAPMRFRFRACPAIWADQGADPETERMRLLGRMNEDLETIIRAAPEQWLWLHRRWKSRPPEAGGGARGP